MLTYNHSPINPLCDISFDKHIFYPPEDMPNTPKAYAPTLKKIKELFRDSFLDPDKYPFLYKHFNVDPISDKHRLKREEVRIHYCKFAQTVCDYYDIRTGRMYGNPSQQKIAHLMNVHVRTVQRIFRALKELNVVEVIRINVKRASGICGISAIKVIKDSFFFKILGMDVWRSLKLYKDKVMKREDKVEKKESKPYNPYNRPSRATPPISRKEEFDRISQNTPHKLGGHLGAIMERLTSRKPPS